MRTPSRSHPIRGRLLAAAALLLATAACDRDPLRDDPRPTGPSLATGESPAAGVGPFAVVDMNERGDIVGNSPSGPYRWTRAGGPQPLAYTGYSAYVMDINNHGVAVGHIILDRWTGEQQAVTWGLDGQPQPLPLPDEWFRPEGVSINDAGVVVGDVWASGDQIFRWSAEQGTDLLPKTGPSGLNPEDAYYFESVAAINNAGDIVGTGMDVCDFIPGPDDCVDYRYWYGIAVWRASGTRALWGGDADYVSITGINDAGVITGCVDEHAFASELGMELGYGSCAWAASESGVVVGNYTPDGTSGRRHAFRWTQAGGLQDLGTLDGVASIAMDVNAHGAITGYVIRADGSTRAFVWTEQAGMQVLTLPRGATWSRGRFINDAGEIAGMAGRGSGATAVEAAARWADSMVDHPPAAHAGGPYTRRITGHRYLYSAFGSVAADTMSPRYWWDMDADGDYEAATVSPLFTYAYATPGLHTIRLVMRDASNRLDTATTTVQVTANVAPVIASTGLPTSVAEGAALIPSLTVRDDNQAVDTTELRLLRYRWEWGDGSVSTTRDARHRYADQGQYTIRLTVTDAGGMADTVVYSMAVGNVAPTGRMIVPTSVGEGRPFTLQATALDDVPADVAAGLLVAFNCGGGFGAYGTAMSIVCPARPDQGNVTVRMRVKDKDGAASELTRTIPVGNVAPRVTASATSPTTTKPGGTFSVSATFTDVAGDAPWRYRIYWGDGASTPLTSVAGGATITGSHAYATPGTYTVQVAVADKDGGSGRSSPITVTVTP